MLALIIDVFIVCAIIIFCIVLLLLKSPFITTLVKINIKLVWLVSSWFIPNYRTPVFMYDILRWQLVFILYCFLVSSGPDVKSVYHLTGHSYVFWVAFLLQLSRFSLVFTSLILTCQWSSLWVLSQYKFILINIHWASWVIIFMFCITFEKFRSLFFKHYFYPILSFWYHYMARLMVSQDPLNLLHYILFYKLSNFMTESFLCLYLNMHLNPCSEIFISGVWLLSCKTSLEDCIFLCW